mgnify:CR=1 FL=1
MTRATLAAFAERLPFSGRGPSRRRSLGPAQIKTELLAGLTVALALVPEAVAFAFVAGVHPLVGLYAAFIVGLITAVFGGRPGMISGATGALAVVMVALVAQHGVDYLFAAVVLMGLLQIFAGIFRLGKFIRLVPHPVMLGFVNGLAIVIFMAQLSQFQVAGADGAKVWMGGWQLAVMLGLVVATMAIIHFIPRLTSLIPAPLAGIGIVAAIAIGFGIDDNCHFFGLNGLTWNRKHIADRQKWKVFAPTGQHFGFVWQLVNFYGFKPQSLDDIRERQNVAFLSDTDGHAIQYRECQWKPDREDTAFARLAFE